MTSNPSSVSSIPAPEFFSQLGAFFDKAHEISSGVFSGKIRGCHIFTPNKNKALQRDASFYTLKVPLPVRFRVSTSLGA